MSKTAIVLFNLGGPDNSAAVEPFLFNLFFDPAIIALPLPLRWLIAKIISGRRAPVARAIYDRIGGKSPLLEQTQAQAQALAAGLGPDHRVVIAMRYWHPLTEQAVTEIKEWGADRIVLLPLYPQFSTTTTGSSVALWTKAARKAGLTAATVKVCCYPRLPGLITAIANGVRRGLGQAGTHGKPRVLFSAHGLPQKIVDRGDPYPVHIRQTAVAVAEKIGLEDGDWAVCYQSRVGPMKWLAPSLDDELERAAADGVAVVICPIAFVSEHSETLVELDMEYRERADRMGVPGYIRVPTVGTDPAFISGLIELAGNPAMGCDGCARAGLSCSVRGT